MDDAILRQKFQSEKDDSEYKAWLQEKEFTARFNAEQAMPGDEVEFLTRYTNEQLEELRDGIKARVKDVEKSLKDFKSSVELQLKSGLDDKLTSTDLAAVLVKERKRNDKELSSLTASLNGLLSTLDARITAASKQKPVVQQIVAPEKKRTPKAWKFDVSSRVDGLMNTVVASADGVAKFKITIGRTPDNFPSAMSISEV